MSCLCIVEPSSGQAALSALYRNLGLKESVPEEVHITSVVVNVDNNSWEMHLTGIRHLSAVQQREVTHHLTLALGLNVVTLIDATDNDENESPPTPDASVVSNNEETDEEYLAELLQRRQERQLQMEKAASEDRTQVLLGQNINQQPQPLSQIQDEERSVTVTGQIFSLDIRKMRSGRCLVTFEMTDGSDSIGAKLFVEENEEWPNQLEIGYWITARGAVQYDNYTQELTLMPKDLVRIPSPDRRVDNAASKRVELHLHTKMSALDGIAEVQAVVGQAAAWGHSAIAITDHGVVQAFPDAYQAGKAHNIKVIYGVEAYLVNDTNEQAHNYHAIIFAATQEGLRNLYELVSLAHIKYFYRRPRYPRQEITRLRSGLIIGSGCEAGELYQAALAGLPDAQLDEIAAFYDFLELQPLANNQFLIDNGRVADEKHLQELNSRILAVGHRLGKPVVATGDVHYINPEDEIYRQILMAGHGFSDTENMAPLYLHTTEEMLDEFAYLSEEEARRVVIENPQRIADMVADLQPIPSGFYPPRIAEAEEEIQHMSEANARHLYGDPLPPIVSHRLKKELDSIIGNGFASLYLIAQKLVKHSVDDGYMVGSRGSVGSSLVAFLCGISEVNPLVPHYSCPQCHYFADMESGPARVGPDLPARNCPHCQTPLRRDGFDIPFETFLGFTGDKVPDIDLNFSQEYQAQAHKYTEELFGADRIFRAGTIGTLAEKTAYGYVRKYLEERNMMARTAQINNLCRGITGVRRTTGQHPGGLMVLPEGKEIYEFTPIQHPANDRESGVITTHFDFEKVHDQLVKLDILGQTGPSMLRMLEDFTDIKISDIPLDDAATLNLFFSLDSLGLSKEDAGGEVGTLAIPEYNTAFARQMLEDTRPKTFAELVDIMGLTHGTDVWLNNAQELVRKGVITLEQTISCRDDIMIYLIRQGLPPQDAFRIMEQVRKGKGLKPGDIEIMKEHEVPDWYISSCNKISYLFPKAHAVAYALNAYWQAYWKLYRPLEFYAAYFTVRANDFDASWVSLDKSSIVKLHKQLTEKGRDATGKEQGMATNLEVLIEAISRDIRFMPVDVYKSDVRQFIPEQGQLRPPLIGLQGVGLRAAESIDKGRKERPFTSIEDLKRRCGVSKAVTEVLSAHGCLGDLPETDQLSLF